MVKKSVALVLSGGGARGCAHIGAIKILEECGFKITSVAGTSMGALVGGIYSSGGLKVFEEWISSLDRMEILKLTDITISSKGFVKGKKIMDKMREIIPGHKIEELPVPFCAVATDITNRQEVVFDRGELYDAIRASISIPTVFQPFKVGKNYYVDGGLVNQIPVNRVKRIDGDILVVVDVGANIPYEKNVPEEMPGHVQHDGLLDKYQEKIKEIQEKFSHYLPARDREAHIGIFNLSNRSIGIMMRRISDLMLEQYPPDILINISKESYSTYDFYKAEEIIKEGELAARKAITLYNTCRKGQ